MRQLEPGKRVCLKNKREKERQRGLFSPQFKLIYIEIGVCRSDGVSVLPGSWWTEEQETGVAWPITMNGDGLGGKGE